MVQVTGHLMVDISVETKKENKDECLKQTVNPFSESRGQPVEISRC